jgi:hypothetical protein
MSETWLVAEMSRYIPFLKMKQNEVGALYELSLDIREQIIPFFDIPRPKDDSEDALIDVIRKAKNNADRKLKGKEFYVDNYDLDDTQLLTGVSQYAYILNELKEHAIIPVVAVNRDSSHNRDALNRVDSDHGKVALRLTGKDVESYRLAKSELTSLNVAIQAAKPSEIHLVIDFRVIREDLSLLATAAVSFLTSFCSDFSVDRVILTSSTIPPNIRDLLETDSSVIIRRDEVNLWNKVAAGVDDGLRGRLIYADYGHVSPDYTDADMEDWLIQKVSTPKVFYTFDENYYIRRGSSFQSHPQGHGQYFAIADDLSEQDFFRDPSYSFGEKYIFERSSKAVPRVLRSGAPGSWLKATLSSHFTHMLEFV